MRKLVLGIAAVIGLGLSGIAAQAGHHVWTLDGAASTVAFGSIKKDKIGESHHFSGLSGTVKGGDVTVEIDLSSVETWIDKRNVRMVEHVFKNAPTAVLSAKIDAAALDGLAVGDMSEIEIAGSLLLGSIEVPIETDMIVVRLSEKRVMAVTAEMIWVSTADAGIDGGVDMLQQLAKLPSITRTFPVTLRLVFDHGM